VRSTAKRKIDVKRREWGVGLQESFQQRWRTTRRKGGKVKGGEIQVFEGHGTGPREKQAEYSTLHVKNTHWGTVREKGESSRGRNKALSIKATQPKVECTKSEGGGKKDNSRARGRGGRGTVGDWGGSRKPIFNGLRTSGKRIHLI